MILVKRSGSTILIHYEVPCDITRTYIFSTPVINIPPTHSNLWILTLNSAYSTRRKATYLTNILSSISFLTSAVIRMKFFVPVAFLFATMANAAALCPGSHAEHTSHSSHGIQLTTVRQPICWAACFYEESDCPEGWESKKFGDCYTCCRKEYDDDEATVFRKLMNLQIK